MSMQFLRRVQQLKVLDAADHTAAVVRSPAFARFKPLLAAVNFDADAFADELAQSAAAGRAAYTERESAQDAYEGENADVRLIVEQFEVWVRKLHTAARAIEVLEHPLAHKIKTALKLEDFDGGSVENIHGNGPNLILNLERLGDLSTLGIPADFAAQGRALLDALPPQRREVSGSGFGRTMFTSDLHAHLDRIVDLMERFERFREFAMVMSDVEIPGLGLSAVRANSGRRARPAAAPSPVPAPADPPLGDGSADPVML